MVDWAVDGLLEIHPIEALRQATILDPACGTGIFLICACHALADRLGEPVDASQLHGWDTDATALEIARRRIGWATAGDPNLTVGDALSDLPDDARFDLLVTNPPYLSTKRGFGCERREALRKRYRTAVGQFDAYALFIELGLRHLHPGGGFAFLVPKPILTNTHMVPVRGLLAQHRLRVIADPGECFAAAVEPVVIVGAMGEPGTAVEIRDDGGVRCMARSELVSPSGAWSLVDLTPQPPLRDRRGGATADSPSPVTERGPGGGVSDKLGGEVLGDWFTIDRGLECGKRSRGVISSPREGAVPMLRGEDVTPDGIAPPSQWFARDLADRTHKPDALFRGPKLLVRRVADRLIAAVDPTDAHVLNTLYILRSKPTCPWTLEQTAAWLNDPSTTELFRKLYGDPERIFPYVRQAQLAGLPMPQRP